MKIKSEILYKIGLKELIGTQFEDFMEIKKMDEGTTIHYNKYNKFNAYFVVTGEIQHTIYTPDEREFSMFFLKGEVGGLNLSLSYNKVLKNNRTFDIDVTATKESTIVYLPFEKIINFKIKNKYKILETLMTLGIDEYYKDFNFLLLKNIYTDKEFFIKYLEKYKVINFKSSTSFAKYLNIKLRTFQRILKKLEEEKIIERFRDGVFLKNQSKLNEYKKNI